jgi:hypothetical protein
MTSTSRQPPEPMATPLHGDAETEAASGLAPPSLRVMQAAGAIRACKEPKEHGGFRRMWTEPDVLKAAVGAAMGEHFAWNIRVVAEAVAKTRAGTWEAMIAIAAADLNPGKLVTASAQDWFLDLIDRKFLFLRVPELASALLPDVKFGQTDLLLGFVASKDSFQMLPWSLGSKAGRTQVERLVGSDKADTAMLAYKIALAAHGNFLSKATINVSMQVRAAWRRLHGLEARFVQDIVQPRHGGKQQ